MAVYLQSERMERSLVHHTVLQQGLPWFPNQRTPAAGKLVFVMHGLKGWQGPAGMQLVFVIVLV